MPPPARQTIAASGRAEWMMRHPELGEIKAVARIEGKSLFASFFVGSSAPPSPATPAAQPALQATPSVETSGATAEMDALFRQMFEMKASDLHLCVGSAPMVRHDGEIRALAGRSVMSAADIERILWPIAPERNR